MTRPAAIAASLFMFLGCNAMPTIDVSNDTNTSEPETALADDTEAGDSRPLDSTSDDADSDASEAVDPISDDADTDTSQPAEPTSDRTAQRYVTFDDPDSDFSTSEVHDIDEEIIQFDARRMTLIWEADGTVFDTWEIRDNFLGGSQAFQVRFGTIRGQRRAYFTETGPATICNFGVQEGDFFIRPTSTTVADHTARRDAERARSASDGS